MKIWIIAMMVAAVFALMCAVMLALGLPAEAQGVYVCTSPKIKPQLVSAARNCPRGTTAAALQTGSAPTPPAYTMVCEHKPWNISQDAIYVVAMCPGGAVATGGGYTIYDTAQAYPGFGVGGPLPVQNGPIQADNCDGTGYCGYPNGSNGVATGWSVEFDTYNTPDQPPPNVTPADTGVSMEVCAICATP